MKIKNLEDVTTPSLILDKKKNLKLIVEELRKSASN
jgi:hypothetical protein